MTQSTPPPHLRPSSAHVRPEAITRGDVTEVLNLALEAAEIVQARLVAIDTAARRVVMSRRDTERVDPQALAELEAILLEDERVA